MKAVLLYLGTFAVMLGLAIWWQVYRYHDCKNVGHSTLYCVMNIGS